MEDVVLMEAVEKYLKGEMLPQEQQYFDHLRKNNPEIDQLVVEHSYFLGGLDQFGTLKSFKHILQEVDGKLADEGLMTVEPPKGKAKVVQLWNRYRRNIAVAASIAGFISILTAGLMITYTKKVGDSNYRELVDQIIKTNREVIDLKSKEIMPILPAKVIPSVNYRATGFLIDGKGFVITNAHVIDKMKHIYVENKKGDYFRAVAVHIDEAVDLAILKITDTAYKVITNIPYSVKRTSTDLGEEFFTLGFPRNEIVYGEGYVSAKSGNDGDTTAYQLNVSANPGNSGGPVINRNGEIIGIITGKDSKADGVVYAAKSKNIYKVIENLKRDSSQYNNLKVPSTTSLKGLDRVQQIKKMEEFVFMVVGDKKD